MNGRLEEKLARIAFGDATPEEMAKIERKAEKDPAAAKALAEFRQMKTELRKLADTPAHQLSNERLREAILAQGLHPKPLREPNRGLGAGWIWMPVAAAILGVGIMKLNPGFANFSLVHHPVSEPKLVMGNIEHELAAVKAPAFPDNFELRPATRGMVARLDRVPVDSSPRIELAARSASGISRKGTHHRRRPMEDADVNTLPTWDNPGPDNRNLWAANFGSSTPASQKAATVPPPVAKNPNSPIVLIDSDPDARTGAPGATEVGTASNVVIGG